MSELMFGWLCNFEYLELPDQFGEMYSIDPYTGSVLGKVRDLEPAKPIDFDEWACPPSNSSGHN